MPKLYELDDYDRCFVESSQPATYCFVHSEIKPNRSAEIWNIIEKFSSDKMHNFRHDRLKRGICISWCKDEMKKYVRSVLVRKYYQERFNFTTEFVLESYTFTKLIDYQIKYNKIVNICINMELQKKYGLKAYSVVEYCERKGDALKPDGLDYTFLFVICALITTIVVSSLYDRYLYQKQTCTEKKYDHYKGQLDNEVSAVIVSFSFYRNWNRLVRTPHRHDTRDLRPMNAFRFFTMVGVILAHCLLFINSVAVLNPEYIEQNFHRYVTMIIINGAVIIQTFFAMSGFLLSLHFQDKKAEGEVIRFWYILKMIVLRYVRIVPAYAFVVLLHATYMVRIQDGPMWKHISESERNMCRENSWANFLFINNYITTRTPCFVQGWYLAVDFQLFVICSFLLFVTVRLPNFTKYIFAVGVFISFVVPIAISYSKNKIFLVMPENDKYAHWFDEPYKLLYIPAYSNFGSYLFGVIGGIVYSNLKSINYSPNNNTWLKFSCWMSLPVCILLLLSGASYYKANEPGRVTLWTAFYAVFIKNIWGAISTLLLIGMSFGIGWIIRDFTCHPFFQVLGRLTYSAYLIHSFFIRIMLGNFRQPLYASDATVIVFTTASIFVTYFASIFLSLAIEFPVTALQNVGLHKKLNQKEDDKNNVELNYR